MYCHTHMHMTVTAKATQSNAFCVLKVTKQTSVLTVYIQLMWQGFSNGRTAGLTL